jgi:hypothetical protein
MNFRDLVTRLDLIEDAGLTLATVKAAEDAAKEKATVEKAKGGWTGFTSWDPKTAGNIAIAKLAQANRFEGLFNSDGDFIIAYGNNEWSSKEGQSPRVAPPTPEDWKPLASLGLIPSNAKGPAGLTSWLTGGKSDSEFKAAQAQSAGMQKTDVQKMGDVEAEINRLQSQTDAPATSTVASADGESDDSENTPEFAEGMYESLVESFGYVAEKEIATFADTGGGAATGNPTITNKQRAEPGRPAVVAIEGEGWASQITIDGIEVYGFDDFAVDLGIAISMSALAAVLAAPTGGGSELVSFGIVANALRRAFTFVKKYVGVVAKTHPELATKEAISGYVKTKSQFFKELITGNFRKRAMAVMVAGSASVNLIIGDLKKHGIELPDWMQKDKPIDPNNPEASVKFK